MKFYYVLILLIQHVSSLEVPNWNILEKWEGELVTKTVGELRDRHP